MVVLSVMLSYMILFYCWTWCKTAKWITRAIKSIPTLFTGLWNTILLLQFFSPLTLMKTYGSWRSAVKMRLCESLSLVCGRSSLLFLFFFFLLFLIFFTRLPSRPFQLAADRCGKERPSDSAAGTGCHFGPAVTPTSLPRWKHAE